MIRLRTSLPATEVLERARQHEGALRVPAQRVRVERFATKIAESRFTLSCASERSAAMAEVQVRASPQGGAVLELEFEADPWVFLPFLLLCFIASADLVGAVMVMLSELPMETLAIPLLFVFPLAAFWERLANPNIGPTISALRKNVAEDLEKL